MSAEKLTEEERSRIFRGVGRGKDNDKALRIIDAQAAENERLRAEASDLRDTLQDADHGMVSGEASEALNANLFKAHAKEQNEARAAEARLATAVGLLIEAEKGPSPDWWDRRDAFLAAAPAPPAAPLTPFGAHDDMVERQPAAPARTEAEQAVLDTVRRWVDGEVISAGRVAAAELARREAAK